ncbi:hypothetical protein ASF44_06400 [Pseudorhodoferax sp. Leaf274]|nr:hypothetical protein ASF44_06400 [Pseudorhodoferax sp. Leaf274]
MRHLEAGCVHDHRAIEQHIQIQRTRCVPVRAFTACLQLQRLQMGQQLMGGQFGGQFGDGIEVVGPTGIHRLCAVEG